jgi:CTP-dependent riboflavin kinase
MGGGTFADMMERDALSQASVGISEALRHVDEARRQQPAITHLREIHVDMGHLVSDVMFDNIFSDMAQHDRIKASNNQLLEAIAQLKEQGLLQRQRAESSKLALDQGKSSMEEARKELQNIRAEAFQRVASGGAVNAGSGDGTAAPPPYVSMEGTYGQQPGYTAV